MSTSRRGHCLHPELIEHAGLETLNRRLNCRPCTSALVRRCITSQLHLFICDFIVGTNVAFNQRSTLAYIDVTRCFTSELVLHTGNPPYLANLVQWHTPCRTLRSASANLLFVTRCNISFGARGFRSAAPTIWNSLPSHVRSCETLTTFRRHLKSHFFHSALPTA